MNTIFSLWMILAVVLVGILVTAFVFGNHLTTVIGKKSLATGS